MKELKLELLSYDLESLRYYDINIYDREIALILEYIYESDEEREDYAIHIDNKYINDINIKELYKLIYNEVDYIIDDYIKSRALELYHDSRESLLSDKNIAYFVDDLINYVIDKLLDNRDEDIQYLQELLDIAKRLKNTSSHDERISILKELYENYANIDNDEELFELYREYFIAEDDVNVSDVVVKKLSYNDFDIYLILNFSVYVALDCNIIYKHNYDDVENCLDYNYYNADIEYLAIVVK